jgi:prepilin-type N-terminal cleavage/methylation domain-containing protein
VKKQLKNKKGFTLIEVVVTMLIAAIFLAITIALLLSTTNLSAHAEKDLSAKQITTEVMSFLVDQTKYATEIAPTEITPVASNDAVSASNYTMPASDKLYNPKWLPLDSNPWESGASSVGIIIPSEYDDDFSYEEKMDFFNDLSPDQKLAIKDESYKRNLIFYVGKESGVPAQKGYLYFKRADDSGAAINVFGKAFYGMNRKISLDISEIQDEVTGKIVVTVSVNLWEDDKIIKTGKNSFELVNIDADADEDTFADWEKDEDDIEIIGSIDPTNYYICKDVKYFDW